VSFDRADGSAPRPFPLPIEPKLPGEVFSTHVKIASRSSRDNQSPIHLVDGDMYALLMVRTAKVKSKVITPIDNSSDPNAALNTDLEATFSFDSSKEPALSEPHILVLGRKFAKQASLSSTDDEDPSENDSSPILTERFSVSITDHMKTYAAAAGLAFDAAVIKLVKDSPTFFDKLREMIDSKKAAAKALKAWEAEVSALKSSSSSAGTTEAVVSSIAAPDSVVEGANTDSSNSQSTRLEKLLMHEPGFLLKSIIPSELHPTLVQTSRLLRVPPRVPPPPQPEEEEEEIPVMSADGLPIAKPLDISASFETTAMSSVLEEPAKEPGQAPDIGELAAELVEDDITLASHPDWVDPTCKDAWIKLSDLSHYFPDPPICCYNAWASPQASADISTTSSSGSSSSSNVSAKDTQCPLHTIHAHWRQSKSGESVDPTIEGSDVEAPLRKIPPPPEPPAPSPQVILLERLEAEAIAKAEAAAAAAAAAAAPPAKGAAKGGAPAAKGAAHEPIETVAVAAPVPAPIVDATSVIDEASLGPAVLPRVLKGADQALYVPRLSGISGGQGGVESFTGETVMKQRIAVLLWRDVEDDDDDEEEENVKSNDVVSSVAKSKLNSSGNTTSPSPCGVIIERDPVLTSLVAKVPAGTLAALPGFKSQSPLPLALAPSLPSRTRLSLYNATDNRFVIALLEVGHDQGESLDDLDGDGILDGDVITPDMLPPSTPVSCGTVYRVNVESGGLGACVVMLPLSPARPSYADREQLPHALNSEVSSMLQRIQQTNDKSLSSSSTSQVLFLPSSLSGPAAEFSNSNSLFTHPLLTVGPLARTMAAAGGVGVRQVSGIAPGLVRIDEEEEEAEKLSVKREGNEEYTGGSSYWHTWTRQSITSSWLKSTRPKASGVVSLSTDTSFVTPNSDMSEPPTNIRLWARLEVASAPAVPFVRIFTVDHSSNKVTARPALTTGVMVVDLGDPVEDDFDAQPESNGENSMEPPLPSSEDLIGSSSALDAGISVIVAVYVPPSLAHLPSVCPEAIGGPWCLTLLAARNPTPSALSMAAGMVRSSLPESGWTSLPRGTCIPVPSLSGGLVRLVSPSPWGSAVSSVIDEQPFTKGGGAVLTKTTSSSTNAENSKTSIAPTFVVFAALGTSPVPEEEHSVSLLADEEVSYPLSVALPIRTVTAAPVVAVKLFSYCGKLRSGVTPQMVGLRLEMCPEGTRTSFGRKNNNNSSSSSPRLSHYELELLLHAHTLLAVYAASSGSLLGSASGDGGCELVSLPATVALNASTFPIPQNFPPVKKNIPSTTTHDGTSPPSSSLSQQDSNGAVSLVLGGSGNNNKWASRIDATNHWIESYRDSIRSVVAVNEASILAEASFILEAAVLVPAHVVHLVKRVPWRLSVVAPLVKDPAKEAAEKEAAEKKEREKTVKIAEPVAEVAVPAAKPGKPKTKAELEAEEAARIAAEAEAARLAAEAAAKAKADAEAAAAAEAERLKNKKGPTLLKPAASSDDCPVILWDDLRAERIAAAIELAIKDINDSTPAITSAKPTSVTATPIVASSGSSSSTSSAPHVFPLPNSPSSFLSSPPSLRDDVAAYLMPALKRLQAKEDEVKAVLAAIQAEKDKEAILAKKLAEEAAAAEAAAAAAADPKGKGKKAASKDKEPAVAPEVIAPEQPPPVPEPVSPFAGRSRADLARLLLETIREDAVTAAKRKQTSATSDSSSPESLAALRVAYSTWEGLSAPAAPESFYPSVASLNVLLALQRERSKNNADAFATAAVAAITMAPVSAPYGGGAVPEESAFPLQSDHVARRAARRNAAKLFATSRAAVVSTRGQVLSAGTALVPNVRNNLLTGSRPSNASVLKHEDSVVLPGMVIGSSHDERVVLSSAVAHEAVSRAAKRHVQFNVTASTDASAHHPDDSISAYGQPAEQAAPQLGEVATLDLADAFTQSTHAAMRREQIARLSLIKPSPLSGANISTNNGDVNTTNDLRQNFREFLLQGKEIENGNTKG
jgi:hypothetical protein